MKILFDQGVPVPLRAYLEGHRIETAHERGWNVLKNGELISEAEAHDFQVFVSTDQHLKYQQNLKERCIGIVVLLSTSCDRSFARASSAHPRHAREDFRLAAWRKGVILR